MNLSKPPPIVSLGPWQRPDAAPPTVHPSSEWPEWLRWVRDVSFDLFDLGDLIELAFGFLRMVGGVMAAIIHAVFHF